MIRRREFIAGLGSAATWPLAARAQQRTMPVIGILSIFEANTGVPVLFRQGLAEQGYVEGRNIEILSRYAESHEDRLPALAEDLVRRQVAAIFVFPNIGFARVARNATATIPIVFAAGGDPIEAGLVASLNRPGGNVTGATFLTVRLVPKRLEIIHQMVPAATSLGYIINPLNRRCPTLHRDVRRRAPQATARRRRGGSFNTPRATQNYRRRGLRTFGDNRWLVRWRLTALPPPVRRSVPA